MLSLLESYDAVAFTSVLAERLTAAVARLGKARGLADEKGWLDVAMARLTQVRAPHLELLEKAARLPELEVVRSARVLELQGVAIDAVERLQAGITFHTGSRMPLLDSLFGKLKFAALRRVEAGEFEKFCVDFEKRLNTQYAKRLLVTPAFEFATPVIEQVRVAFTGWKAGCSAEPLGESEAAKVADALRDAAGEIELPLRQVRLLAEAALAPVPGAYDDLGIGAKPKKRPVKAAPKVEESMPEPVAVEPPPPAPVVMAGKAKKPRAAAKPAALRS